MEFEGYLAERGYKPSSVRKTVNGCRRVLRLGIERGWVPDVNLPDVWDCANHMSKMASSLKKREAVEVRLSLEDRFGLLNCLQCCLILIVFLKKSTDGSARGHRSHGEKQAVGRAC